MEKTGNSRPVLGIKIDNLTKAQIRKKLEGFLERGQHHVILPYSLFLLEAQKDEELKNILNSASLSVSDGSGPVLAAGILNGEKLRRFSGVDLVELLCSLAADKKEKVFFYGGLEGVAAQAARKIGRKYQDLKVAGTRGGFGQSDDYIVNLINATEAHILLVALGMPKQEKWIARNFKKMPAIKIAVGVGGAFDFISGRVKRAPKWMQQSRLEWLWRLAVQPWRIKKVLRAVLGLWWLILKEKFKSGD